MACSCSSTCFTSFAAASPSTATSPSSSSSAAVSLSFLHSLHQLPGGQKALLRLDCQKVAKQRLCVPAAVKQGKGQYDKPKKPNQRGGGFSAGVAVKDERGSWKGGGTQEKHSQSYNRSQNPKSFEKSNLRPYNGGRTGSRQFSDDEDEDQDDSGRDRTFNSNTRNNDRKFRSKNPGTTSRGVVSIAAVSDEEDDEDDEEDWNPRIARLSDNKSSSDRNFRLSKTSRSNIKGGSRLRVLREEEEEEEEEEEGDDDDDFGEVIGTQDDFTSSGEEDYRDLLIKPIPPAGFVLAEDGSVSIMAPPEKRVTTLVDVETKLSLDCLIRRVFSSSDGRQCFLLCPLDTPVEILRIGDGDVLAEVSDEELEDVFPTASYELAKRRLHLIQSGYCLTLRGGFCYSEDDVIDLDTEYSENGEGNRALNEGVEVASFELNSSQYIIFTPSNPLMFVAYKDNKTGELLIADEDLLEDEDVLDAIDEEKEFEAYMDEENVVVDDGDDEEEE